MRSRAKLQILNLIRKTSKTLARLGLSPQHIGTRSTQQKYFNRYLSKRFLLVGPGIVPLHLSMAYWSGQIRRIRHLGLRRDAVIATRRISMNGPINLVKHWATSRDDCRRRKLEHDSWTRSSTLKGTLAGLC